MDGRQPAIYRYCIIEPVCKPRQVKPIKPMRGLSEREPLCNIYDIHREIEKTDVPKIKADRVVRLGACGFGMPLLKSHWTLDSMEPGEILRTESSHPCSYPDIHAWVRRNKKVELVGEDMNGGTIIFYLRRLP